MVTYSCTKGTRHKPKIKNKIGRLLHMSNVNGVTCLESKKYKGLWIDRNKGEHDTEFYSAFNPKNKRHVHDEKKSVILKVVDCYWDLYDEKYYKLPDYGRAIRNKAEKLIQNCPVIRK
jgi:hypothetical protein